MDVRSQGSAKISLRSTIQTPSAATEQVISAHRLKPAAESERITQPTRDCVMRSIRERSSVSSCALELVDELQCFTAHMVGESGIDDAFDPRGFDIPRGFRLEVQDLFCGA